ncbi:MAG: FprA family A-type flavoprotein [candidate division Zixibacteria bacterium]|nr:FprA family A-type flavoprotein [candidate division Zixibacteria bacterium]
MSSIKIADNVYWVGVKDPHLRVFDIIMETKQGTTYNAYLIKGSKQAALIDSSKAAFTDEYLANIAEIMPVDQIDYLIVNHTEPDHSGSMAALLKANPKLKIICAAAALPFVKNVLNADADLTGVKDNHVIDLGGKKLLFKAMPYMHWPDTMMEFLEEDRILFSCDGFAAHIAFDSIYADESKNDIDYELSYYYDSIMRPFGMYIRRNLPKLDGLDIGMIAPSHGPVFRKDTAELIDKYKLWSADKSEGRNQVAVFYVSAYGNTKRLAEAIAANLGKQGLTTKLVDIANLNEADARDIIEQSKAVLFGTPTFNGDAVRPTWDAINLLSTVTITGKKAAVFGSYGWGGEGVKLVAERLAGLRLKVFEENFRARLIPSDDVLTELNSYCERLAEFIGAGK